MSLKASDMEAVIKADREHLDVLSKGFDILALAATFICAIQGQIMSTTIGIPAKQETIALRAINTFFLSGLVLDLMSACLAFLTSRWLQRLSDDEKDFLQSVFSHREKVRSGLTEGFRSDTASVRQPFMSQIICAWFGMSLFVPMPLLVFGVMCMILGIYTYTWTQHTTVVAAIVTFAGVATLPFLAGIFMIGRGKGRRRAIIRRLSNMQGDW